MQEDLEDGLLAPFLGKRTYKVGGVLVQLAGLLVDQRRKADAVAESPEGCGKMETEEGR